MARRSRSGCAECRRRHRRCDEQKPVCAYCQTVNHSCSYAITLSWGGRPFKKSKFGKCLGSQIETISSESLITGHTRPSRGANSFVYTTSLKRPGAGEREVARRTEHQGSPLYKDVHEKGYLEHVSTDLILQPRSNGSVQDFSTCSSLESQQRNHHPTLQTPMSGLSWIPQQYRLLMDHFMVSMTRCISCHQGIHRQLCSAIVPMALGTSHLFAAILLVSACHRASLGLQQSLVQVEYLRSTCLSQLQDALATVGSKDMEPTMATTLMLCFSEIVAGEDKVDSWRVHFQGARAIWRGVEQGRQETTVWKFLDRLYKSIEVVASSCGLLAASDDLLTSTEPSKEQYIDDLTGFSTALLSTFDEINNLTNKTQREKMVPEEAKAANLFLQETCEILIQKVDGLLSSREPVFCTEVDMLLSPLARFDFFLLDEAYHHMALLQLYSRASGIYSKERVQRSIAAILACVNNMSFSDEPCPSAAVLPPLFVAGSHSNKLDDRQAVVKILYKSEIFFGMGNVKSARESLKRLWAVRDSLDEAGNFVACCNEWQDALISETRGLLPY